MIQYPKNTHLTLPSVVGAFGSMNILRDPPKSIHTRYIEKVGDTNKIYEQVDAAADRVCESILPFARGVNPMVNVSYTNEGTNGGQMRSVQRGTTTAADANRPLLGTAAAYLPYSAFREGAFRPPIKPPQDLLPLSRLPRLATFHASNPGAPQLLANLQCHPSTPDMRALRQNLLNVCASSNATFNLQTPASKPYEVRFAVQERPRAAARTNLEHGAIGDGSLRLNGVPSKGTTEIPRATYASVRSNVSACGNGTLETPVLLTLDRTLPSGSVSTNPVDPRVSRDNDAVSRDVYLPARTPRGGFENAGCKPVLVNPSVGVKLERVDARARAERLAHARQAQW
jgi:hypothetical protein